jgi:hypothetical protein
MLLAWQERQRVPEKARMLTRHALLREPLSSLRFELGWRRDQALGLRLLVLEHPYELFWDPDRHPLRLFGTC